MHRKTPKARDIQISLKFSPNLADKDPNPATIQTTSTQHDRPRIIVRGGTMCQTLWFDPWGSEANCRRVRPPKRQRMLVRVENMPKKENVWMSQSMQPEQSCSQQAMGAKILIVSIASLMLSAIACRASPGSEMLVAGGAPTTQHPEVVWIQVPGGGSCTGTFISPNKVLTAGHCLKDESSGDPQSYRWLPESNPGHVVVYGHRQLTVSATARHPKYPESPSFGCLNNRDLAILTVQDANATDIAKLASASPPVGANVTMVGFGNTDYDSTNQKYAGNTDHGKFTGTNQVKSYPTSSVDCTDPKTGQVTGANDVTNMISIEGDDVTKTAGSDPDHATTGPGDSGGPLFDDMGLLAGTVSGVKNFGSKLNSAFVNLSDPEVRSFIDSQIAADIPTGSPALPGASGASPGGSATGSSAPPSTATSTSATPPQSQAQGGQAPGGPMTMGDMVMDPNTGMMCMGTMCMGPNGSSSPGSGGSTSCSNGVCTTAPAGSSTSQTTNPDGTVTTCVDGKCSTQ